METSTADALLDKLLQNGVTQTAAVMTVVSEKVAKTAAAAATGNPSAPVSEEALPAEDLKVDIARKFFKLPASK